jgi:hypothetical protein
MEIDPKYDYILSKVCKPEDKEQWVLTHGLNSLEGLYNNILSQGVKILGDGIVGKTIEEIMSVVPMAPIPSDEQQ